MVWDGMGGTLLLQFSSGWAQMGGDPYIMKKKMKEQNERKEILKGILNSSVLFIN